MSLKESRIITPSFTRNISCVSTMEQDNSRTARWYATTFYQLSLTIEKWHEVARAKISEVEQLQAQLDASEMECNELYSSHALQARVIDGNQEVIRSLELGLAPKIRCVQPHALFREEPPPAICTPYSSFSNLTSEEAPCSEDILGTMIRKRNAPESVDETATKKLCGPEN